ncbi:HAD family hydrolase [Halobaculum gomorrense]|uniref:Haloacid dehalogenase superfamily, subfamily IA, variant 1 with third motif having Dx(3-4)D or Dx(3-4)E n=1 Tax=Halobaculum gomorrense TaxID=43928 RepID=A0A1M5JDT6_9EURY|nr:HAD family hydrolase [Halobaculum gomorrense]SHG38671.1 haloacid dehalogenase superfamily, subfamily IA, variant 1 with third motif having Dx(3-4)D or Dx(3-4)E [Halobaculum gomorrense]
MGSGGAVDAGTEERSDDGVAAVSFDLFDTLVDADAPDDPAAAVAAELRERGVVVPDDWTDAYAEPHLEYEKGVEHPLHHHVAAALASRASEREARTFVDDTAVAVRAAFDRPVETRSGAAETVAALAEKRPVGVLSNCSVPGLVERTLERSAVDAGDLDAVVPSVECGWRKPDTRAFEAVAADLGVPAERLLHVGDDPETDGGAADAGAQFVEVGEASLPELPSVVAERWG